MTTHQDTLKQIAEDTFLLAANIRTGEPLDEDAYNPEDNREREAMREWRIIELVTNLGERICATAGITLDETWVPTDIRDLLDPLPYERPAKVSPTLSRERG